MAAKKGRKQKKSRKSAGGKADAGRMLTSSEAIKQLGITRSTFARWLRTGKLRGIKVGRSWRFAPEQVKALLEPAERKEVGVGTAAESDIAFFADRLRRPAPQAKNSVRRAEVLAELVIADAIAARATDVHLQLWEQDGQVVRSMAVRIDGALHPVRQLQAEVYDALVHRLKITAGIDPASPRPQNGRIKLRAEDGRPLDLRVSTVPGVLGEALCIRILDPSRLVLGLDQLRMTPSLQQGFEAMLGRPNGIVMVVGPTGSGKTTTLYCGLMRAATPERKVLTAENPVEYLLPGCTQIQVRESIGLTYPAAIQAIMRQDPDVILVGELGDGATAEACAGAALTGHLVLTSMHAESAPAALARLIDFGVGPFLLGDAVLGILAQRLVRGLCAECRTRRPVDPADEAPLRRLAAGAGVNLPDEPLQAHYPSGCDACGRTGYRGRAPVNELLIMDRPLAAAVRERASVEELAQTARAGGMKPLAADAIAKVLDGITSPTEALRVAE